MGVTVIDVTEADFDRDVIERSRTEPVVVDFWAAWCGPCRALGPLLEEAAAKREGQVVLAKVDTDANPRISQDYGIQGIPAVKAFRDGAVIDEFVGAQGRAAVERFFDALVPSEADGLAPAGDEDSLRAALAHDGGRADAALALARLLVARGDSDEALRLVESITGDFQAEGLAARLRLAGDDRLDPAFGALDAGEREPGLDLHLAARPAAGDAHDDIRRVVVGELDRIGPEAPLARDVRRRLAAALY
ncbi:MAG: putative thioredoxin [Solirubrobacteraceae bacterium]|nr:putative thioredoxin [Solirubrobacteraceae bacterium]